jgi:NADH-quinone oxidoreductase subunit J
MAIVFDLAATVAVLSTVLMLISLRPVHALLYLIISLLAVAVVFYTLGAPFIAALEVITYAGAIMVLFVFVVMLLNLGTRTVQSERALLQGATWIVPSVLAGVLLAEFVYVFLGTGPAVSPVTIGPLEVGRALFGPYLLGVELASMLLLGGLVGAYHLGRRSTARAGKH